MIANSAFPGSLMLSGSPDDTLPRASVALNAVAGVAGGDDDDDATPHEAIDLDAERALAAREPLGLEVVPDAQVHAVNQHAAAVAVDLLNSLEGLNDAARPPVSLFVEHLHADDLAARRHARDRVVRLWERFGGAVSVHRRATARTTPLLGFPERDPAMMPATCVPCPASSRSAPSELAGCTSGWSAVKS